ncbi:MAG: hypothetical protein M3322_11590 [Actinomycetota bacterium]|nr:hypothetical protein [Actinomycetota bacterium]
MPLTPVEFGVYLGSFADASYGVWWDDDHLVYESFRPGYHDREQVRITPSEAQWRRFWHRMDEIGVWRWRRRYEPGLRFEPRDEIRDGTHWSLTLAHAGRSVESSGDSAGPDAVDLDESPAFAALLEALSRLIGGRGFS